MSQADEQQAGDQEVKGPSKTRLIVFYAVLIALLVAGVTVSISAGNKKHAQDSVAGGYNVAPPNPCLGQQFDLNQSGEFANLDNMDDTLTGQLRVENAHVTGDVDCVKGGTQKLDARVIGTNLAGTLGGKPVRAQLKRDAPTPGALPPRAPDAINGMYKIASRSTCLGGLFQLNGSGSNVTVVAKEKTLGRIHYSNGQLTGQVTCTLGGRRVLVGQAVDQTLTIVLAPPGPGPPPVVTAAPAGGERISAQKQREFGATVAAFFLAVVVVMIVARLFGWLAVKVAQPRVMGEVVAGIVLGPTVFGAIAPGLQSDLFPTDIIAIIGVVANLGLIFYMFMVGLELDPAQLKGRAGQAAAISNASVALPLVLGLLVAIPIYTIVGPDTKFVAFALFMGVSMSITAFPVLARILVERRMLKRPVGALTMASAAIDDVTAWFLIALATAVAVAGSAGEVVITVLLAIAFCLVMFLGVRPLIARVANAYEEIGRVPPGWIAAIFAGVLLSAFATEEIGIAVIFGGFIMGMVMPRHAGLTEDVTGRIEDFVVTLLLPLFFAYTGLRTNMGLLDRPELWLLTLGLIAVAIAGKFVGAMAAARLTGFGWRASGVIGTLMNTRGLTELIVLNIALEQGVISEALFAALVIMALVTTLMTGPILKLIDPKNVFGAPVEEEFEEARRESVTEFPELVIPERSILVAPQSDAGLPQLRSLAEPLARSQPPRELILARLVKPPRAAAAGVRAGLQTENKLLHEATQEVQAARDELIREQIAARAVAFISSDPGKDLSRVAEREEVDLVLMDGRRPLLGEGVPRGEVGAVLEHAPSDVAVLVAKEGEQVRPSEDTAVIVPFGGADHDWAALELGAWIASATSAPLKLLGAAGQTEEAPRLSRMLADAGLLVQQYAAVAAEPLIAEPGREGIIEAAAGGGLLVIGLSQRWRQEGLGPTRSEIAKAAPAPVLFVRRGTRPGALAPPENVTRFSWSSPGMASPPSEPK